MLEETRKLIKEGYGVEDETMDLVEKAESLITATFKRYDDIAQYNQVRVLKAFHKNRINESHFSWANGYGHDDFGRDAVARVYSDALGAEKCIVGPFIQDGTHALACTYLGLLRPG
ncbi:MAG: methionine gamma-lyase family protein, partial [Firmicutes bacterium]|nr:methionine gamma-lyase family protein [Bacillota bacterium]